MSRSGPGLQRRLSRLDGRLPSSALDELSDRELWALQRDLIDAALENDKPGAEVLVRVRAWARSFQIGGADDLPIPVLWRRVRPLVDRQAGGMELDWLSPRMQAILSEGA
ncbi:MAG TPA: hypothetical protein VL358_04910 [Caulobacteraceae bacterium]|jgi:hypothetical protein|nr:hypothetical protein [Caulobacteraceae bacterium]